MEAVLLSHPQIADAGVIGLRDPAAGELPMAWVVRKPGATVAEKDVAEFVSGNQYEKHYQSTFTEEFLINRSGSTRNYSNPHFE